MFCGCPERATSPPEGAAADRRRGVTLTFASKPATAGSSLVRTAKAKMYYLRTMGVLVSILSSLILAYTVPEYEVTVERDVVYSTARGYWCSTPVGEKGTVTHLMLQPARQRTMELKMDIYTPEGDASAKRPLLLMMHGGSFFIGNKGEKGQAGWCEYFASLGYVAVSIDYRLGFHPDKKGIITAEDRAFEDADTALRFLLERKELRIDPECIFAAGTSAGAMLALRLAFRSNGPRIRAIANCWGSVHDLGILELAQTSIISFQSLADPVMPYGRGYPFSTGKKGFRPPTQWFSKVLFGTAAVHERALALGLRAEHHAFPEPRHALHLDGHGQYTERFFEIRDMMATFFAEELAERNDTICELGQK